MLSNIEKTIKELSLIVEVLQGRNTLHPIEKDIVLAKIREVYASVLVMKTTEEQDNNTTTTVISQPKPEKHHHDVEKEQIAKTTTQHVLLKPENELPLNEERKVPEINKDENKKVEQDATERESTNFVFEKPSIIIAEALKTEEPAEPTRIDADQIGDIIIESVKTISEIETHPAKNMGTPKTISQAATTLSGTHMNSILNNKLKPNKVQDISKAIGINDKIFFVKQLFDNDHVKYNNTIAELNKKKTIEEAVSFLNSQSSWDLEDPSVVKFIETIKRKY